MFNFKRMFVILLTFVIALSLVACGNSTSTPDEPKDVIQETTPEPTKESIDDTDEPIQVSIAISVTSSAKFAEGEDYTDNLWTKLFKERHNVEVVVDWISDDYDTKLNLAIASGELPDMFTTNKVQFSQLSEADMLADLKSSYEEYASPSLKNMIEPNWDIVETTMIDGKMLAMPRLHYGYECMTKFMWARNDWVEESGIKEIKTINDFENMMDIFMNEYGAEYGTMLDKSLSTFFNMSPTFHAYPTTWLEDVDGNIAYGATLPETKDAVAQWAEWFKEGYIKADFATMDSSAMLRGAYNGEVGTYAWHNWAGWQVGKDMVDNQGDDSYFVAMNLPSVDDEKTLFPVDFPNSIYSVVRKDYEHPEVLFMLTSSYVDVLNDAFSNGTMTMEEVLPFGTNSMHHVTGPFKVEFTTEKDTIDVFNSLTTDEVSLGSGNAVSYYNEILGYLNDGDLAGIGRYLQMGHESASLVLAVDQLHNEQILKSKVWGQNPQALLDYGSTLNDILIEGYTKIIMGIEDISYYDTLIETWRKAGGDEVTLAVNEMYGK